MKRVAISLFLLSFLVSSRAQMIEIGEFYLAAHEERPLKLVLNVAEGKYLETVLIQMEGVEGKTSEVYLVLDNSDLKKFYKNMRKARETYLEWKQTAIDNNIQEFTKKMKIKSYNDFVWDFYGTWKAGSGMMTYGFIVALEGDEVGHFLGLVIPSATADGGISEMNDAVILFSSVDEMDEFMYQISQESIAKYISELTETNSLFIDK